MAELDSHLFSVAQKEKQVKEKIAAMKANADKINPSKKSVSTKVLR